MALVEYPLDDSRTRRFSGKCLPNLDMFWPKTIFITKKIILRNYCSLDHTVLDDLGNKHSVTHFELFNTLSLAIANISTLYLLFGERNNTTCKLQIQYLLKLITLFRCTKRSYIHKNEFHVRAQGGHYPSQRRVQCSKSICSIAFSQQQWFNQ